MKLHISVVTPEKTLLDEEADEITIPTTEGEISVLPEHIPLLSQIAPGELIIKKGNHTEHLAIMGGFIEVSKNTITLLADFAVYARDINAAKAQAAKERAEKAMKEKTSEQEFRIAEEEFLKAILELKIAKKVGRVN